MVFAICVLIVISGFTVSRFFSKRQLNYFYGILLTLSMFLCGLLLYNAEKKQLSILEPKEGIFICTLSEFPSRSQTV
jgi:hypothetical protein